MSREDDDEIKNDDIYLDFSDDDEMKMDMKKKEFIKKANKIIKLTKDKKLFKVLRRLYTLSEWSINELSHDERKEIIKSILKNQSQDLIDELLDEILTNKLFNKRTKYKQIKKYTKKFFRCGM